MTFSAGGVSGCRALVLAALVCVLLLVPSIALSPVEASSPPPPDLEISPSYLQFGATPVGSRSDYETVRLRNVGQGPAFVSPIRFDVLRPGVDDFEVDRTSCPAALEPGEGCDLRLRFTPLRLGTVETNLRLSQWIDDSLPVSGRGTSLPVRIERQPSTRYALPLLVRFTAPHRELDPADHYSLELGGPSGRGCIGSTPLATYTVFSTFRPGTRLAVQARFPQYLARHRPVPVKWCPGRYTLRVMLDRAKDPDCPSLDPSCATATAEPFAVARRLFRVPRR